MYKDLLLKCTELCRSVKNDQAKCQYVMNGVVEWTNKLRMKDIFKSLFLNTANAGYDQDESIYRMNFNESLHAITEQESGIKVNHILISSREHHHSKSNKNTIHLNTKQVDSQFVAAKSRSCIVYRGVKHLQYSCEMITKTFNCRHLAKNDIAASDTLATSIVNVKGMVSFSRCINDQRIFFDDCPKNKKLWLFINALLLYVKCTSVNIRIAYTYNVLSW